MNPYLAYAAGAFTICLLDLIWAVVQPTKRWRKRNRLAQQAATALQNADVVSIQHSHGPDGSETVIHLAVRPSRTVDGITVWGDR